jgi:hypothetical protein
MAKRKKNKNNQQKADMNLVVRTSLSVIFTAVMIGAVLGVVESHLVTGELTFGSLEASASLLAVVLTLMYWTKHTSGAPCPHHRYMQSVVLIVLVLATVASTAGLVQSHLSARGLSFGTLEGSLAIVVFAVTAKHCAKHVHWIFEGCRI